MQNNIYNFALKSGEINRNVLCEMCDQMPEEMRKRFIEAVLGIVDVDEIQIPVTSKSRDGVVRTMREYNYLMDRVEYSYLEHDVRWFKDEKKASEEQLKAKSVLDMVSKMDDELNKKIWGQEEIKQAEDVILGTKKEEEKKEEKKES